MGLKISQNGIDLIKQFEGCRLTAYQDSVGVWTIGYGWTKAINGVKIYRGMKISQETAERLLVDGLKSYESKVNKYDNKYHFNQNQFDALVSFCYNIGSIDGLTAKGTRTIKEISNKILAYDKAGGKVLSGLTRRRIAEKKLFDKGYVETKKEEKKPQGSSTVLKCQQWLNIFDCNNIGEDGFNGKETKIACIKVLQTILKEDYKQSLTINGKFDIATKLAIKSCRMGDYGRLVKLIECCLFLQGYNPQEFNGNYIATVRNCVIEYQKKYKLGIDGTWGKQCWNNYFK